ncbi:MAG: alpha/beta fold hydrolase [Deltaproteobacteria bacterium]|nr:alpha/beta fold hydrolase [Deltaproteobacteria bacterium]
MDISNSFHPMLPLRPAGIQTMLGSSKFRTWGANRMSAAARDIIFKTPDGVKLLGSYSQHDGRSTKGILLHGWEGSVDSTYILCTGRTLFRNGYNILRLNLRDHGQSHHLNKGIFYAVMLEEVFQAVKQATRLAGELPVFLAGFSLGGNFVLRILQRCINHPIVNLHHAVAISPVLDPEKATFKTDQTFLIRRYFLKKWFGSLKKKQQLFPILYDFSKVFSLSTIAAVTEVMLNDYSNYGSSKDYFRQYSVVKEAIKDITIPTTIITSADDPIIPVEDFYQLKTNDFTTLVIQPYGGHNGFIDGLYLQSWYEQRMIMIFDETARKRSISEVRDEAGVWNIISY